MTDTQTCETCGQRVRVEGNVTRHYVGLDAERIKQLENENLAMRKVLEWYADEGQYQSTLSFSHPNQIELIPVGMDRGHRAREIIAKIMKLSPKES